jgi:hypothetical protein
MRPLTPSEKFLLVVLGLIAFGGVNFFGYRTLSQKSTALQTQIAEAKADEAEAKVELVQQSLWSKRADWVKQHQPTSPDEGDAKAQTLQTVLTAARGNGLKIEEQSLKDTVDDAGGFRVEIDLTLKGPMEGLTKWLAGLQDPASFYGVPYLSLKADTEQKTMICSLHIYRYFRREKA